MGIEDKGQRIYSAVGTVEVCHAGGPSAIVNRGDTLVENRITIIRNYVELEKIQGRTHKFAL